MTATCIAALLAVVFFAVMLIVALDKLVQRSMQEDDDEPTEWQANDLNPRREE